MKREVDAYKHRKIKGWHHHHGPHANAVHYHDSEFWVFDGAEGTDIESSDHYNDHVEYGGNAAPCRDSSCWFTKALGA